ncbi:hypothetical protein Tco_0857075 [Tanacetum coccineum]|uniref:Reverse transcriptase domain-containing protein n=1 Tax=Tanacetum coccineum TaxID=301880 RepID=A0ABQ5B8A1_9ASTR
MMNREVSIVLTRWIEKMESVIDNSGCTENQKVRVEEKKNGIWNRQRPGQLSKGLSGQPFKRAASMNAVRMGHNQKACYECGSPDHLRICALTNVKPSIVNPGYVIEVADGKKVEVDRIIRDCKLELGNFLFSINLIPMGHGSFDVIVGMDWLS